MNTWIGTLTRMTFAFAFTALAGLGVTALTAGGLDQLGLHARAITAALPGEVVILYFALMGALAVAVHRRGEVLRLQSESAERHALELDLHERALNAHAIVSVTNPDGILSSVNENFIATFGRSRDACLGKPESEVLWKGANDPAYEAIAKSLKRGTHWCGENMVTAADGTMLVMQATIVPLRDKDGKHIKTVSIRTDITDSRKAGNARFLKELLDQLHDEVYIFEVDSLAIRYVNDRAMERCDWTPETVDSKTILDTTDQLQASRLRAYLAPILTGEAEALTIEMSHPKGPVEVNTRLYTGDDGQKLFVSVLRDITERKKIELAKMETVSMVSHELRTPLTSIKGALRMLKSGVLGPISAQARPVLEIADRNSERLLLMVNDILDLEKMRAGKMQINREPVDLLAFLTDAVAMNKGYGDEHNVRFVFQSTLTEAVAAISTDRMMQVLSNLMSNAAKFSPEGGIVRVTLILRGSRLRIGVKDDGPGIPETARKSIFDSFVQLEGAQSNKRKGTGLGLTISKSIVEAHGGKLDFESTLGEGTNFFIDLPLTAAKAAEPEPRGIAAE